MDQGRGAEVRRREVESHLPQVPLPEPHLSDDQGSLADHEETGNALKLETMGLFCFVLVFLFLDISLFFGSWNTVLSMPAWEDPVTPKP